MFKKVSRSEFVEISNIAYQWKAYEIRNLKNQCLDLTRHTQLAQCQFQYCLLMYFLLWLKVCRSGCGHICTEVPHTRPQSMKA